MRRKGLKKTRGGEQSEVMHRELMNIMLLLVKTNFQQVQEWKLLLNFLS